MSGTEPSGRFQTSPRSPLATDGNVSDKRLEPTPRWLAQLWPEVARLWPQWRYQVSPFQTWNLTCASREPGELGTELQFASGCPCARPCVDSAGWRTFSPSQSDVRQSAARAESESPCPHPGRKIAPEFQSSCQWKEFASHPVQDRLCWESLPRRLMGN